MVACTIGLLGTFAIGIVAVGIDRADRADAAGRRPGARAHMIGRGDALATLDQRPIALNEMPKLSAAC